MIGILGEIRMRPSTRAAPAELGEVREGFPEDGACEENGEKHLSLCSGGR